MVGRQYDNVRDGFGSSSSRCCSCRIGTDSALAPHLSAPVRISTYQEGHPATLRIDAEMDCCRVIKDLV